MATLPGDVVLSINDHRTVVKKYGIEELESLWGSLDTFKLEVTKEIASVNAGHRPLQEVIRLMKKWEEPDGGPGLAPVEFEILKKAGQDILDLGSLKGEGD